MPKDEPLPLVMTIGHSTHTLEEFISLLQAHGATRVVDVRTVPRSRHNPQFNQDSLPQELKKVGLGYVHLPGLGGLRHAHEALRRVHRVVQEHGRGARAGPAPEQRVRAREGRQLDVKSEPRDKGVYVTHVCFPDPIFPPACRLNKSTRREPSTYLYFNSILLLPDSRRGGSASNPV